MLTIRLIVDNYSPHLKGMRSINRGHPWMVKMRAAREVITLKDIEDRMLRGAKPFDPRIHFAINCASWGCPKLPATRFDPERLSEQLDKQARRFINDPQKVRLDRTKNILYYSSIFSWFRGDFLVRSPNLLSYILKYISRSSRRYILNNRPKIKLKRIRYDWRLNRSVKVEP